MAASQTARPPTLLLSAGDASGEQHLAALVTALRALVPDARFVGMGGEAMRAAGVELVVNQRELAIGGLIELAAGPGRIASAWRRMDRALRALQPDLVILTDSSGFNLPFARRVRRRCKAPILYYVAPQVWAWRPGRIAKLARRVDRVAVLFPFESAAYTGTGLRVDFVGHPMVDQLADLRALSQSEARERIGLPRDAEAVVTLLPGSRRNEIRHQLSVQLAAARRLSAEFPGIRFALALAPSIEANDLGPALRDAPDGLRLVAGRTHEAIRAADVVLAKPGTVTVEAMLLDRPMVVMGRAHPLTAAILRRLVKTDHFAMPNLIAGEPIVPELLQEDATPEAIASALGALLCGPQRDAQLARLAETRAALGEGGAAERAAQVAYEMLAR